MNFQLRLPKKVRSALSGLVIGSAGILPGISGASLTVLFGVHEDITALLADPIHRFRQFIQQHFLLVLGLIIGFIGTSIILTGIFFTHTAIFLTLFSGFIVGTLPSIYRRAAKSGIHRRELLSFFFFTAIMVALAIFNYMSKGSRTEGLHFAMPNTENRGVITFSPQWFFSGAILGCGSLLPGISASFFLMYLDWFSPLLSAVASLRFLPLAQTALGFTITILTLSRVTNWLYRRFNSITSFAVLGCTLGSFALIIPLLPPLTIPMIIFFIVGFSTSFFIGTRNK